MQDLMEASWLKVCVSVRFCRHIWKGPWPFEFPFRLIHEFQEIHEFFGIHFEGKYLSLFDNYENPRECYAKLRHRNWSNQWGIYVFIGHVTKSLTRSDGACNSQNLSVEGGRGEVNLPLSSELRTRNKETEISHALGRWPGELSFFS